MSVIYSVAVIAEVEFWYRDFWTGRGFQNNG